MSFLRPTALAILVAALSAADATNAPVATSWDACIAELRAGHAKPFAVYLGAPENRLPRAITAGVVQTSGLPVALVGAADRVMNPMDGRPMSGADLQRCFGGTAGTILFFNERGLPIYEASAPQVVHGNDYELIALYCGFVAGRHYLTMTIPEYARALGKEGVIVRAVQRTGGRTAGREVPKGGKLVKGRNALTGEEVDPWREPGVFNIYTANPRGRVFLAQVSEIWNTFKQLSPRITVIVPTGTQPDVGSLPADFHGVLVQAPIAEILRQGPSPHLVIIAGDADATQRGLILGGFQPAEAIAAVLRLPLDREKVSREIPFSEIDDVELPRDDLLQGAHADKPDGEIPLMEPQR